MRARKFFVMLVLSVCASACSSTNSHNTVSTQHFVTTVAASDAFEISSSKMVASKTHDANVKQLAKQLVADHTKSSNELKTVLANNGMRAPSPLMTQDQKQTLDHLKNEHHFNGDYLDVQEKVHNDAINLFESYRDNGENEALRGFAERTLPTLRKHLDMIEQAKEMRDRNNMNVRG